MMAFKDLTLGAPAAERDNGLKDYFVKSAIFAELLNGRANILIGNRGSGKSALFRMLADKEKKSGSAVVEIYPEDYSYELLSSTLKNEISGVWAKQGSYAASWKFVLFVTAMKEAEKRYGSTKTSSYKKIKSFLRDKFKNEQFGIVDTLLSYMRRFEHFKIGSVDIGLKAAGLKSLYDLEEINSLLPALTELLSKQKVVILIDELDKGWDASEDARQFVAGLFQAAIHVNRLTPNLRVLISLRRELYDNIPEIYEDAQKVRDLVKYVEWNEDGLKELIGKRIKSVLKMDENVENDVAWGVLFSETLSYRKTNSFNYVVDRTLYRPREIIQFCNDCLGKSKGGEDKIDYDVIVEAEKVFSRDKFNDVSSEYKFQYPALGEVFELFRGTTYNLPREELEEICFAIIADEKCKNASEWVSACDEKKLIKILYEVGFIKAKTVGGQKGVVRSGSRYAGVYQMQSINLDSIKEFQVHPMFRVHLALKEKKSIAGRNHEEILI